MFCLRHVHNILSLQSNIAKQNLNFSALFLQIVFLSPSLFSSLFSTSVICVSKLTVAPRVCYQLLISFLFKMVFTELFPGVWIFLPSCCPLSLLVKITFRTFFSTLKILFLNFCSTLLFSTKITCFDAVPYFHLLFRYVFFNLRKIS